MKFILNESGNLVYSEGGRLHSIQGESVFEALPPTYHETLTHQLAPNEVSTRNVKKCSTWNNFTGKEEEFSEFRAYLHEKVPFHALRHDVKETFTEKLKKRTGKLYSFTAPLLVATATATTYASGGIFWDIFMEFIFPYLVDIAKVYCVIKIAQSFYQERRGTSGSGTAVASLIEYGKWYLLFMFIPVGVELIDQIGQKMLDGILNR